MGMTRHLSCGFALWLAFDEALFDHFLVTKPQVGDISGAEPQNIFQRAADFAEAKIDADPPGQFDQHLCPPLRPRPR